MTLHNDLLRIWMKAMICAAAGVPLLMAGVQSAHALQPKACVSGLMNLEEGHPDGAAELPADGVLEWATLQMLMARQMPGYTPPVISRAMGYVGIGLYEALLPSMPGYRSIAAQMKDAPYIPPVYPDATYDWSTVAAAYMHAASRYFYAPFGVSDRQEEESKAADELWARQEPELKKNAIKKIFKRSVRRGQDVAAAMYAWSMSDGGHEAYAHNFPGDYTPPTGEDKWEPNSQKLYAAMQPYWGKKREFVMKEDECVPPAPPAFSTDPQSQFMKEVKEIYDISVNRTEEQKNIALFWADEPGRTASPPGHMQLILTDVLRKKRASLALAAEAYAKVGVALADAFVECWRTKYTYHYPRPDKMIQRYITPVWTGVYITPPFPEYTSGHSVQSSAAFKVMSELFGDRIEYTDHNQDELFYPSRSYHAFSEMAKEAAMSRMYGGVHFRSSVENGLKQGECIAETTLKLEYKVKPDTDGLVRSLLRRARP